MKPTRIEPPFFLDPCGRPALLVAGVTISYSAKPGTKPGTFHLRHPNWAENITGYTPTSNELRNIFLDALDFMLTNPEAFSPPAREWIEANRAELLYKTYEI